MRTRRFAAIAAVTVVSVALAAQQGEPVDPRPANNPSQKPAFAGQTDAPARQSNVAFDVVKIAEGLQAAFSKEILEFVVGEPLEGSGDLPKTERPTLFVTHRPEMSRSVRSFREYPARALWVAVADRGETRRRKTKPIGSSFGLRHSSFVIHSDFGFRHSGLRSRRGRSGPGSGRN